MEDFVSNFSSIISFLSSTVISGVPLIAWLVLPAIATIIIKLIQGKK